MMKELYIIGAGGFGRETAWLVERINKQSKEWKIKGFIDDDSSIHGNMVGNYQVLGGCEYLQNVPGKVWCVCAVGTARIRKSIIEKIKNCSNIHFATLIDPSVIMSERVNIGEGTIICAGTILTVDITIGSHVIINLDCTVGHDVVLGDYVTVYPSVNISGNVTVGTVSELGTGMQIIQGKTIIHDTIVGAGAVVVNNLEKNGVFVGVPAKEKE